MDPLYGYVCDVSKNNFLNKLHIYVFMLKKGLMFVIFAEKRFLWNSQLIRHLALKVSSVLDEIVSHVSCSICEQD